jgi:hypothetical protein
MDTRRQIFEKLLMKHDDSIKYAEELVNNAEKKIKYLLPKYFYDDDAEYDEYFGTDYYFRNKTNIITFFAILIERINAKYNDNEYLRILSRNSEEDFSREDIPTLKREISNKCEDSFTSSFFDIFKLGQIGEFKDYGSTMYETFFILNLLSIVLLDKFYYFEEKDRLTLTIEDNSLWYFIWVSGHVVGIFKCDDNTYKYVDNDLIEDFNFKEFICVLRRVETLHRDTNKEYQISYNPYDGVYIETNDTEYYFCEKNKDRESEKENIFEVYKVTKTYEFKGDYLGFKQSNELVKKLYSPNYRLFIEINKNNTEAIEKLYIKYRDDIRDDFVDIHGDTVFEHVLITKKNEQILKMIIYHLSTYDYALTVLCQKEYREATFFKDIVIYIFNCAHTKSIKITKLYKLLSEYKFLRELYKEYLLTIPNPTFIIEKDEAKTQLLITPVEEQKHGISVSRDAWGNKYLKYDIFYKKYIMYKQKYLNLKNKLKK